MKKMLRERFSGDVFEGDISKVIEGLNSLLSMEKKVDKVSKQKKVKIKIRIVPINNNVNFMYSFLLIDFKPNKLKSH